MSTSNHHFLALGDSYTIGVCVLPEHRWPTQLADHLLGKGICLHDPVIVAQNGWTTRDLLSAISQQNLSGSYDLVSLLIGVNNQFQGLDIKDYREDFRLLIQHSIFLAGKDPERVMVLSIPDWGLTSFAAGRDRLKIRKEIDIFNKVNEFEAKTVGAHYVDLTPLSRLHGSGRSMLAEDGLHPSEKMYTEWVRLISPVVSQILLKNHTKEY